MLSNHDTYIKILKKKPSTRSKADLVTLATFLQTLKFFRGLPKTFVQELCTIIDLINVDANTTIFREGEVGKLFYVILSGAVDVKISAVDKRGGPMQTKLVNLGEGSHFGDLALMKSTATVVSTHACELLIIAEKDYNAILKKLQREDMEKRMALLDKIPIFQSVEWTSEIMKEVSYVLVEQRLPAGTVVYKQGDKAVHLYFLIRGEVIISQIVKDPKSLREHSVVVERLGPFNVLVLSKYDVFNRLSRTARETLRGHTHRHKQPVVVFDQLYKTLKWDEYKAQVIVVHALGWRFHYSVDKLTHVQRGGGKHTPLIEGNELLLLSPIKHSTATPSKTLANYTVHYNPDVTTQDRKALLRAVVDAHAREAMKTLDEGNPMVYLDYLAPAALTSTSTAYESIMHPTDGVSENFIFSIPPVKKQTLQLQDIEHSHMPAELKQAKCNFACVSTLLVGDASEPSLCVYGCYPTEAEATDFAENGNNATRWIDLSDGSRRVKSSVTLEQKMDALHDILNARHQPSGLGTSLQKMQKVQRFGHIMKLRLHKAD
ncbi:hypothetical protein DYB32_005525 [Aphanomyces invadans]|uniref:Cyclic nucleotide-binding domain-containing protein n=1 Tax=Aphanomyces invadans TaxID=157072 RepID=A0A3R6Z389_9STRA|nr:hypothetical protein DYB32_005525 [Aphanomyces invadans]